MAETNFVDYVKIFCRSGKGGAGSAHLRRERTKPRVVLMVATAAEAVT